MSHAVSPFLVLKSMEIISKSARNFTTLMWPFIKVGYISESVFYLGLISIQKWTKSLSTRVRNSETSVFTKWNQSSLVFKSEIIKKWTFLCHTLQHTKLHLQSKTLTDASEILVVFSDNLILRVYLSNNQVNIKIQKYILEFIFFKFGLSQFDIIWHFTHTSLSHHVLL